MNKIFLSFFALLTIFSYGLCEEFYSPINPYKTFAVKSSVLGEVTFVKRVSEKSFIQNETIIKFDDSVDLVELNQTIIKLNNLKEIYQIEKELEENFNKISSKTKLERDAQKIKVLTLSSNIADIEIKIATLKNNISKKTIKLKNVYLSSIEVEVGDFVNSGSLLYKAFDLSKGKLEIFLPINEIEKFKNKTIYINGVKTNLKINKISKIADEKNISTYKCEIIINNPKVFSKLVKVEFK